jgi:uncharacterized protein (UPF0276 family)
MTDGEGQLDLDTHSCKMNRGDWNLARKVINQSKIQWQSVLLTHFKSKGTDIIPALMQNGVEYFASYLCSIFRACLAYGNIPIS